MAECKSCKQKTTFKEQVEDTTNFVSKSVIWFAIVWTILGAYGLITLISKIFH